MGRLSAALGRLVETVAPGVTKPIELQRRLKLDSKLCWQVFNVIRGGASLAAAQHVPGKPSLNRLLAAATAQQVPGAVLDDVRAAVNRFNELVTLHGVDRSSFDSMASGASNAEDAASVDLFHRRNAYRSESHIWGVQVDAYLSANLIHPTAGRPDKKDELGVTVRVGQRRLRADAPVVVHRFSSHTSLKMLPASVREPLDLAAVERYHAPLLPQFCSHPLPELKTVIQENGWTQIELAGSDVGRQASVDLVFGGRVRDADYSLDESGRRLLRQSVRFITPAELLVFDTFVHRPTYGTLEPHLVVFPRQDGSEPPRVVTGMQRLPVREPVVRIAASDFAAQLAVPEYPRYAELIETAARDAGWDVREFDLYRLRLPYPVLNSIVRVEFACADLTKVKSS